MFRRCAAYGSVAAAVGMSVYHMVTAYIGTPMAEIHYPVHLLFVLTVLFGSSLASYDGERQKLRVATDLILLVVSVISCGYLILNAEEVSNRMIYAFPLPPLQMALGIGLVAVILEAARRTIGMVIVVIAVLFLIYAYFGNHLPGLLWHRGYPVGTIIELSYLTQDGIWNIPISVMANYVFLFVLFGSLLLSSGAGSFFTDLAQALTGRMIGGSAKTAVISSALMGMLSGSAAANVVTTGSFTIPAMKRSGYTATFAAGVEAVASAGGQLTPPIMGAAAFLMIEFVGVSYGEIIGFAAIPAFLYFLAVFAMVDLEARRLGLRPAGDEAFPSLATTLRRRGYLLLPLAVMIWLLMEGYTPTMVGFWSTMSLAALVAVCDGEKRRYMLRVLFEAFSEAPRLIAPVAVACAIGGLIAGIIAMTGLGIQMSNLILDAANGIVIVALVLTMLVAVILGMGMPTAAAYIILAALLAPGLAKMGISLVSAHMFIIYCAAMSSITPPVAIASYAAAAIAGSDPWKTSWVALKLGISVIIIPYMFVYGNALLGLGTVGEIVRAALTASVGIVALSVAAVGWCRGPVGIGERVIALAVALAMIHPAWWSDLVGLAGILIFLVLMHFRSGPAKAGVSGPGADDPPMKEEGQPR